MSNELLDILARRREDNQKEAKVSLVAGLIGQALVGETGGSVAAYGAKQAESAMAKSAKDDDLAFQSAMKAQIEKQSLEGKKELQSDKFSHNGLMELLKQTGRLGSKPVEVRLPDGSTRWTTAEEAIKNKWSPIVNTHKILKDAGGNIVSLDRFDPSKESKIVSTTEEAKATGLSPKFLDSSRKLLKDFDSNSEVKDYKEVLNASSKGLDLLNTANMGERQNILAAAGALNSVIRLFDKGALSDYDRAFVISAIGTERAREWLTEFKTGEISQRKLDQAQALLSGMGEKAATQLNSKIAGASKAYGFEPKQVKFLKEKLMNTQETALSDFSKEAVTERDLKAMDAEIMKDPELKKSFEEFLKRKGK
jgi:hypothetical protein